MKTKRHSDALAIQDGACNPVAILRSIDNAVTEIRAETPGWDAIRQDSAIRLMLHQLCFLCDMHKLDGATGYSAAYDECAKKAAP